LPHLPVDVLGAGLVRILRGAVLVETLDGHERVAELALPLRAVADEDHLLARFGVDGAVIRAEDDMQSRHLLVALRVVRAQKFDALLDRARAPTPAVVGALGLGRRPRVGRDAAALEVFLDPDETDLEP